MLQKFDFQGKLLFKLQQKYINYKESEEKVDPRFKNKLIVDSKANNIVLWVTNQYKMDMLLIDSRRNKILVKIDHGALLTDKPIQKDIL